MHLTVYPKAHLESSHRRLHGFEDFIISKLPQDKMIERVPGVKVKNTSGKVEIATISRFDISLEELRKTRFIELYRKEHNERARIFSVAGRYKKWQPMEKFKDYISNCETFYFKETDIEECLKYGFRKEIAHVRPNGKIRFKNKDYQVVTGDFYGGIKSIKVKVSEHNKKLYIFELPENGIGIGEAMLISETEKPIYKIKKNTKEKILKKNEFEHLVIYLERQGMTIKKTQLERLMLLHKKGLNVETAKKIIEIHKKTYNSYLKNSSFNNLQVGIILCNLFFTHFAEYKRTLND